MRYLFLAILLSGCEINAASHNCNLDAGVCESVKKDMSNDYDYITPLIIYNIIVNSGN